MANSAYDVFCERMLTDWDAGYRRGRRGFLARLAGATAAMILRDHRDEFTLLDARGVVLRMLGVGVGRDAQAASSLLAGKLVGFWTLVCERAHARACLIESSLL